MANNKKSKNLLTSYKSYAIIPAVVVAIVLAITIALVTIYAFTRSMALIIVLDVVAALTFVAYVVFYIRLSKRLKNTYYNQLFETTLKNINKINNNDVNLVSYGESDIKEIQMLDKATSDIKAKLESSYLLLKNADYSNINLEYVDKERNIVTYKSFKENIANIIFVSQSYRNVIIEVYFDLPSDAKLSKKDKERLLKLYHETFKEHVNVLYMFERCIIL